MAYIFTRTRNTITHSRVFRAVFERKRKRERILDANPIQSCTISLTVNQLHSLAHFRPESAHAMSHIYDGSLTVRDILTGLHENSIHNLDSGCYVRTAVSMSNFMNGNHLLQTNK